MQKNSKNIYIIKRAKKKTNDSEMTTTAMKQTSHSKQRQSLQEKDKDKNIAEQ